MSAYAPHPRSISVAECEAMRGFAADGLNSAAIARRLECDKSTVRRHVNDRCQHLDAGPGRDCPFCGEHVDLKTHLPCDGGDGQ